MRPTCAGWRSRSRTTATRCRELVAWFDLSVNEECHFYDECEQLQPFIDAGKPVLNAEYVSTKAKAESLAKTCAPKRRPARPGR
jgi:hypothetical protein